MGSRLNILESEYEQLPPKTKAMRLWNKVLRLGLVVGGYALYVISQYLVGYCAYNLWWYYVAGFLGMGVALCLAFFRPLTTFLIWLVVAPVGIDYLQVELGAGLPNLTFDRAIIMSMAVILLAKSFADRKGITKPHLAEILLLGYLLYCLLSLVMRPPDDFITVVQNRFNYLGLSVMVYYVTKAVIRRKEDARAILIALVIAGTYCSLLGVYEHIAGQSWNSALAGTTVKLRWGDVGGGRSAGPFGNPVAFGALVGTVAFIAVHLAFNTKSRGARLMYAICALINLYGCYLSFSRGAYLAPVAILLMMPFAAKGAKKKYVALGLTALVVLAIAVPIVLQNKQIYDRMYDVGTVRDRIVINATLMSVWRSNLLFGTGLGNLYDVYWKNLTSSGGISAMIIRGGVGPKNVIGSHNTWLSMFAELGLVGGILYVGSFLLFLGRLLVLRAKSSGMGIAGSDYYSLVFVAAIGYSLGITTYEASLFTYPTYVYWILFAIAMRCGTLSDTPKEQPAMAA